MESEFCAGEKLKSKAAKGNFENSHIRSFVFFVFLHVFIRKFRR